MNTAIKAIRLMGNLSNKSVYEYGPNDIAKMSANLTAAVQAMTAKFDETKNLTFKFDED
jgi:hypothetical protein